MIYDLTYINRNKARLVAQGHIKEDGIDYEEVFAPVARIEAISLFLAYASFMGFMVYQMDVKSAFLYGIIEEVVKALYGFHQASRACKAKKDGIFISQDTEKPLLKGPDGEDVDVHTYKSMIGSLMYLTSSRPDIMFTQCKKQTVVATSSTEAEYVVVASCCAQVLWIRNQLLDYGLIRNVDSPTKFYMYPRFLQLMIREQVGDLSTYATKYTSHALTQKVFTNMRMVGKRFFDVETPLFEGMIVEEQVAEGDDEVHDEGVPTAGVATEGDVSVANDKVPTADEEPSIPSPTPSTPPPQPSHDIPSTSQVQPTPPKSPQVQTQSPQPQPQPTQDAGISMNLLQELMDTYTTLSRRVKHLELDKIAQDLEITKLKKRVKKLERRNKVKVLKLRRLQKVGTAQKIDTSDETMMDDVSNQERMIADMDADADVILDEAKDFVDDAKDGQDADVQSNAKIQGRTAESQAKIYKINLDHANKVLSMHEEESEPTELKKVVDIVTTVKIITKVVTAASTTIIVANAHVRATITTAVPSRLTATPSKGILVEEPKPLKKQAQIKQDEKYARELEAELNRNIDWDEVIDHVKKKAKEYPAVKKYQALKRKPQTKAQARKNMMIYLKNVAGFKMDNFKGMSYDDIRHIFEAKFDSNIAFLQRKKEQIDEEEIRTLKRINETPAEKAAKRKKLDKEIEELKRHL
nr:ribonuclease H-like domain, reverse transcriptase, RNA-dependent DNA polymerase [Tanacetum cinerariifolium]